MDVDRSNGFLLKLTNQMEAASHPIRSRVQFENQALRVKIIV